MWWLAESLAPLASATSRMMKLEISSIVAVSLGSRGLKRMMLSLLRAAPTTITRPSTSSALTRIEPRIAVSATIFSPALSAKMTTKNSGRLPSVDCIIPVAAAPNRSPTCSVANETIQATPASAMPATTKAVTWPNPFDVAGDPREHGEDADDGEPDALASC